MPFLKLSVRVLLLVVLVAGSARAADTSDTPINPADVRADFQALYTTLQQAHFDLYARVSKEEYDRLYTKMLGDITAPASQADTAVRFQRFVAFGKVAHARIDTNYRAFDRYLAAGGKAFPLLIRVVDGKTFVTENRSGVAELHRGDQIIALDGQKIDQWLVCAGRDLSADTPYLSHALMELDFPMLIWLELGSVDSFKITVRQKNGGQVDVALPARTAEEMKASASLQPAILQRDANARIARMLEGGIAYLQPGPFYNNAPDATNEYDNSAFRAFIDAAFQGFLKAGATSLLIDLRDNPGGDSSFSDLMVRWFADRPFMFNSAFRIKVSQAAIASNAARVALAPDDKDSISAKYAAAYTKAKPGEVITIAEPPTAPGPEPRFKGRVYVLVNRNSYSNTVAVAATVQDFHFGTVIGEETADLATTYGAMETFELPKTGLKVGFPKANIIRPNGDLTPRGVVPDITIKTPIVEGPEDPVLQAAIKIVSQKR
jgi:C-terminal processing protease CtpA/Prc